MDRKLTTILAADLVGYSRLMAADEEGVIRRLRAVRAKIVDPAVVHGGGRVIKTMGDGLLIEFGSPVAAVRAALTIQRGMLAADVAPTEERLRFRIGVHLGDVVIDGDDLLGDGVNVAARLETLSPAGGLCISRSVQEQVHGKVDAMLTSLGPQRVKNLPNPVDVWRVEVEGAELGSAAPIGASQSIAVLPFDNMSRDPDQGFLADGIVEDVITELSRFRELAVISRNSSSSFRGKTADVRQIGQALGARYVVEGSVRRGGDRLRLTAQLIDATDGSHVWAGRWDRTMEDLFDLQDELTSAIVAAIAPEIGAHERVLASRKPTENLTAWELAQRAHAAFLRYSPESIATAKTLAQRAIEADPGLGLAYTLLARVHATDVLASRSTDRRASLETAINAAERAIELDSRNDAAHAALAFALKVSARDDDALKVYERAHLLNPNNATTLQHLAAARLDHPMRRDAEGAVAAAREALRLSPNDPFTWVFHLITGLALAQQGDYEPALEALDIARSHPQVDLKPILSTSVVALAAGQQDRALALLAEARGLQPDLTVDAVLKTNPALAVPPLRTWTERLVELGLPVAPTASTKSV